MINKLKISAVVVSMSLFFNGCGGGESSNTSPAPLNSGGENNSTSPAPLNNCERNISATLSASSLNVMQNTIDTGSKITNNMYVMLVDMNKMNERVLETTELSAKTFAKIANDFNMTEEGATLFKVDKSLSGFIIKTPLNKNYILASSPNRFFPDQQTLKTLFSDSASLTKALNRAISTSNKSNNLYITILQIETNGTITNLTNGLLIPKSKL